MPHHEDKEHHAGKPAEHDKKHDKPGHKEHEGKSPHHEKPHHEKPPHEEEDEDDDDEEADKDSGDSCDDEEEKKHPGCRKARRRAARKWRRQHNLPVQMKIKDMTPEQKKDIRHCKHEARKAFKEKKHG